MLPENTYIFFGSNFLINCQHIQKLVHLQVQYITNHWLPTFLCYQKIHIYSLVVTFLLIVSIWFIQPSSVSQCFCWFIKYSFWDSLYGNYERNLYNSGEFLFLFSYWNALLGVMWWLGR